MGKEWIPIFSNFGHAACMIALNWSHQYSPVHPKNFTCSATQSLLFFKQNLHVKAIHTHLFIQSKFRLQHGILLILFHIVAILLCTSEIFSPAAHYTAYSFQAKSPSKSAPLCIWIIDIQNLFFMTSFWAKMAKISTVYLLELFHSVLLWSE